MHEFTLQLYLIPGLKKQAGQQLAIFFFSSWDIEELFKVADYLYSYGPEGDQVRIIFARGINNHLVGHEGYMKDLTFRTKLMDRPIFARDILMGMSTAGEERVGEVYCKKCGVQEVSCSKCQSHSVYRVVTPFSP